jgi:hypothetical protein
MTNRKASQIANSIQFLVQIPVGDELVQIIGTGDESTNLEALASWIEEQSDLMDIEDPSRMVEQFAHRLQLKIQELSTGMEY